MKVRFTPSARAQLLETVSFIRRENPIAAKRFRQRSAEVLKRLERFPESGPLVQEFPDLPYREVSVVPYRFFYRIRGETVWVVSVWHGAQIPEAPAE